MRVAHNLVGLELERQPKVPNTRRHIGLDEHILGLEVPVGNGGLDAAAPVPGGRYLGVEVGEAGRKAQADAAQLVEAERVELEMVAEGAALVEGGHQPELHLEILAPSVHACPHQTKIIYGFELR